MKELVVIIGTVILGAYIFNMMTGDDEDSLRNISGQIMEKGSAEILSSLDFGNTGGNGGGQ